MIEYKVTYWKPGKLKGTRNYVVKSYASDTFETLFFEFILEKLCGEKYDHSFMWAMLNNNIFVQRTKAVGDVCEYHVSFFKSPDCSELDVEYMVLIQSINNQSIELFRQEKELLPRPEIKPLKTTKSVTKWLMQETPGVRRFLFFLNEAGSLKALKKEKLYSKAAFYRNLKVCRDKGYIKEDKLVKRLLISRAK